MNGARVMTEPNLEPTDDDTPDGTQLPTEVDMAAEEGDAGVGLADLPDSVFAKGD